MPSFLITQLILHLSPVAAVIIAATAGPLTLTVRAVLRRMLAPDSVKRWQRPATFGLAMGLVGATAIAALESSLLAETTAVLALLLLMASLDLAWRWLPFVWTLTLLGFGVLIAGVYGGLVEAALGIAIGAGTLWGLQVFFQLWRGIRALGTGDIWLAAGLGAFAGPLEIPWILCLAALTALGSVAFGKVVFPAPSRQRLGVAYGAHLCLAYLVLLIL